MTYSSASRSVFGLFVFSVPRNTRRALGWLPLMFMTGISACTGSVDPIGGSGGSGSGGFSSGTGGSFGSGGRTGSGGAGTGGATATGGSSSGSGGSAATGGGASGGAASGGAQGSGGESGDTFKPCPETGTCKVLPLGDSITFGLGYDGGYRVELFRLAHSEGHDITFTGTQSPNGPSMVDGVSFPRNHAGISGQTIDQIAGRIPNPDLGDVPHIILIHAGTNDMYGNAPDTADVRLGNLMDKLIAQAPDALLVFSNIIPFPQQEQRTMTFNSKVEDLVDARAAEGAHIMFVDQFADFPEEELGDGVHPNQQGYNRMGAKWYDTIKSYLP